MGWNGIDPFLDTSEGRAFFPYHRLASGYLIARSEEASLKRFLRRMQWALIVLIAAIPLPRLWGHRHDFLVFVCAVMLSGGLWHTAVWVRCCDLPRTRVPMPRVNATQRAAAAVSNDFLEFAQLVCLLFAVGGAAMFWFDIGDRAMDLTIVVIFGGFWLWYCRIAQIKRREARR